MATINVRNASELNSALSKANGGDKIVLASGNYGNLDITNKSFSKTVTIVSENPGGAKFSTIDVRNSDYVKIDGVTVTTGSNGGLGDTLVLITDRSTNIQFVNSEVYGKVDNNAEGYFGIHTNGDVKNITIADNYIHDVKVGAAFFSSDDVTIRGNTVDRVAGDSFKFAAVHGGVIEGNVGARTIFTSSGEHYDFMQFQRDSSDLLVRWNISLPETRSNIQGIFFNNGTYRNIDVEYNIIASSQLNGLYTSTQSSGMVAHNNTLVNIAGGGSKSTIIRGFDKTYDNIAVTYAGAAGNGTNLMLQNEDSRKPYYQGDFYADSQVGKGLEPADLIPKAGSLAAQKGAIGVAEAYAKGWDFPTTEATSSQPSAGASTSDTNTTADDNSASGSTSKGPDPTEINTAVFFLKGDHEFKGQDSDVYEYAHDKDMALKTGTLAFTFNADTVGGTQGLVSKDAHSFGGGGHHFTSYIKNGTLVVRFQDGSDSKILVKTGLKAHTDYDLQVSFGNGKVTAMLDGKAFGSASLNTSWSTNTEHLQIGANGWGSKAGQSGFDSPFDGTISNVLLVSGVQSYSKMQTILKDAVSPPAVSQPATTSSSDTSSDNADDTGGAVVTGAGYYLGGDHEFTGSSKDVIQLAPGPELKLAEATISLTFNADTVSGSRGILSKDAKGLTGSGEHFTSYIKDGKLIVRFQDGESSKFLVKSGIQAHRDYDLEINFGNGRISASLDGATFGDTAFDASWVNNNEYLQVGANGWGSVTGQAGHTQVFDGTISDVLIVGKGGSVPSGPTASYADAKFAVGARLDGGKNWGAAQGDDTSDQENLIGSRFNDTLIGNNKENIIQGGTGNDKIYGLDGNDTLEGGEGADGLFGGNGLDTVTYENAGSRVGARIDGGNSWGVDARGDKYDSIENLTGSAYDDLLTGNNSTNVIKGGAGNDAIFAKAGRDDIDGGEGNDRIYGQGGSDTYRFSGDFGRDRIFDFEAKNNGEKIDLSAIASITSFSDLKNNHMSKSGSDVIIDAGSGNAIILVDTNYNDLHQYDFIF